jgi:hypothetical protein
VLVAQAYWSQQQQLSGKASGQGSSSCWILACIERKNWCYFCTKKLSKEGRLISVFIPNSQINFPFFVFFL